MAEYENLQRVAGIRSNQQGDEGQHASQPQVDKRPEQTAPPKPRSAIARHPTEPRTPSRNGRLPPLIEFLHPTGSSGYVYGLSARGARALNQAAGIPLAQIPYEADLGITEAYFINHQLAVNRCLIALWRALEAAEGHRLVRWNTDPHLRMRYRAGRGWQVIHPDGLAQVRSPVGDHWLFFEIDRGTEEIRRYELKVRRYVRFWRSGAWRSEFPVFPELRITTTHRARVARLRAAAEDALRSFAGLDSRVLNERLRIAVAWEREFLADPLGPLWEPAFGQGAARHCVLRAKQRTEPTQ